MSDIILDVFTLAKTKGEIGIEIEVEGRNLPSEIPGWRREHDGSLRGEETAEYVLRNPIERRSVSMMLNRITEAYADNRSRIDDSYRTSTHVHLNVQELTVTQVYNIITLYFIFEEYLVRHCGEHREGNLFCLRLQDAEAMLPILRIAAANGDMNVLRSDNLRYAAINVAAIPKYGSLEFRSMRGTSNMEAIKTWVDLLLHIKDAALRFDNPVEIIDSISALGTAGLAEEVFGDMVRHLPLDEHWEQVVFHNMRKVQLLAFARNWNEPFEFVKENTTWTTGIGQAIPVFEG